MADELGRALLRQRHVLLTGEIDDAVAALVCAQLLVVASDDTSHDPVVLMINSPGGSVDAGFAIYDTMQTLGVDVATVCSGLAASMGQFLLCAGTPGMRYAHRHSQILMHQPHGAVPRIRQRHPYPRRPLRTPPAGDGALDRAPHGPTGRACRGRRRPRSLVRRGEALEYGMVDHIVDRMIRPASLRPGTR